MIFEKICTIVGEILSVDEDTLDLNTAFEEDLGADSLDLVEIMMAIEEEFEVSDIDEATLESIKTIGDAVDVIKDIVGE